MIISLRRDIDGIRPKMVSEQCSEKKKFSVLLVDDDPIVQRVNKMMLKKASAEAETEVAVNGMEAVELCVAGAFFDVIFMDLEMPVMNGIEATRKLREMGVESMIVGVTSRASEPEIVEAFMGAGLNEFYGKPLTVNIIKSLIKKISN